MLASFKFHKGFRDEWGLKAPGTSYRTAASCIFGWAVLHFGYVVCIAENWNIGVMSDNQNLTGKFGPENSRDDQVDDVVVP